MNKFFNPLARKSYFQNLFILCLLLSPSFWNFNPLYADQVEYTTYYFGDNLDNTVATSSFSLAKTLWSKTQILLDIELDQTTAPPIEKSLDGVSSASRPQRNSNSSFKKNRGQIIAGLEQGLGENTKINGNYYFSQEVDYTSHSFVTGLTQEFLQKNLSLSLRAQYTMDSVGEILESGAIQSKFKETHQVSFIGSQLLSTTTILRLGGDIIRNQGFLSDPYRKLLVPNTNTLTIERRPDTRFRQDLWTELSQYLQGLDGSFNLMYRYYWDDWGVQSNTFSIKLNKYITPDWILSPEYRYYAQSGADWGEYGNQNGFDKLDFKLNPFTSNNVGFGVSCFLRAFAKKHPTWDFLTNTSVSVLYFHYFNDAEGKSYSADIVESKVKFAF